MSAQEPYQTAEVAGPKKAMLISKPIVVAGLLKRAKRALLVVGSEATKMKVSQEDGVDLAVQLAKKYRLHVVATAHLKGEFLKRGFFDVYSFSTMEIGERLSDIEWDGLDGQGSYNVAVFLGLPYYVLWVVLSGLKHKAPKLTTITLDPYYHPHASWSFTNLELGEWCNNIKALLSL